MYACPKAEGSTCMYILHIYICRSVEPHQRWRSSLHHAPLLRLGLSKLLLMKRTMQESHCSTICVARRSAVLLASCSLSSGSANVVCVLVEVLLEHQTAQLEQCLVLQ